MDHRKRVVKIPKMHVPKMNIPNTKVTTLGVHMAALGANKVPFEKHPRSH